MRRAPSGYHWSQQTRVPIGRRWCGGFEAEVAGGEVKLLVVEGVVGDVHLAVDVGDAAVALDGDGGVVVEAGGSALEEAGDDDDAGLRGRRG